jgi:hypothetical protein
MIAHVAGAPVEELLLPLLSGVGTVVVLGRARIASRLRRPKTRDDGRADA